MFRSSFFAKSILGIVALAALSFIPGTAQADRPGGGVHVHSDTVVAQGVDTYEPYFLTGVARVDVIGDHTTDLDCSVVTADDNGVVITSSTDDSDVCTMTFLVLSPGIVRVNIVNYGDVYNDYRIVFR